MNKSIAAAMVILAACGLVALTSSDGGEQQAGVAPSSIELAIPEGSAEAGRDAFVRLACASCHRVPSETGLPEPVSANQGPDLGLAQAQRDPGWIASAIVVPSHDMPPGFARPDCQMSAMGDYSEAMTVRELVDLVAYLRTLSGN